MEALTYLILYAWILPSILVITHTAYCAVYLLVTCRYTKANATVGVVTTLFTREHFTKKSNRRPGKYELLLVFIGSILPIISGAILLAYIHQSFIYLWSLITERDE